MRPGVEKISAAVLAWLMLLMAIGCGYGVWACPFLIGKILLGGLVPCFLALVVLIVYEFILHSGPQ